MFRRVLLVVLVCLSVCLMGCVTGDTAAQVVDETFFQNEKGSLTINNPTDVDLVFFAGNVEFGHVLGGIKAKSSRTFDISRITALTEQKGAFLARCVSYDTYVSKSKVTAEDVLWTDVVVYDFEDPTKMQILNVYEKIDEKQKYFIYVNNASEFLLQLHEEDGGLIATLPPLSGSSKLWINESSLAIYPTYTFVDTNGNIVKVLTEDGRPVSPSDGSGNLTVLSFYEPSKMLPDIAFVTFVNNTTRSIQFENLNNVLHDQNGRATVNSGRSSIFELSVRRGEQLYSNLICLSYPKIEIPIPATTFKSGYEYEIVIDDDKTPVVTEVGKRYEMEDAIPLSLEDLTVNSTTLEQQSFNR